MEFINSEWDYGWFPSACIYFGQGKKGKEKEKGEKEGKEEKKGKKEGVEGKTGKVLKKGKKNKGENKEEGKRGGKKIKIIFLL